MFVRDLACTASRWLVCALLGSLLVVGSACIDGFDTSTHSGGADEEAVAVSAAALSAPPESSGCTSSVSAGRQYWICTSNKTWSAARVKCQNVGLDLAVIGSSTENAYIKSKAVADAWIGGSDQGTENVWKWEPAAVQFWQGTYSGSAVGGAYTNWGTLQPNSSTQDCLEFEDSSGKWEDEACSLAFDYVCEGPEDLCPNDPKDAPGQCGCATPDTDGDNDGTADCNDGCPSDNAKTVPGQCGCGLAETDSDGDDIPNCQDGCPHDPDRGAPGQCGCLGDASLKAAGTPCNDGVCPANDECDGEGSCGSLEECAPTGNCTMKLEGNSIYSFCHSDKSWSQARDICRSADGMDLARVDDAAENAFIEAQISTDYWLGGSDSATEGSWHWALGDEAFWSGNANGAPVAGAYNNWLSGQPNNLASGTGEDCLQILGDGKWLDDRCSDLEEYVCEGANLCENRGECGCCAPGEACGGAGDPSECGANTPAEGCVFRSFGVHQYWFCEDAASFNDARTRCQAAGFDLAIIDDLAENTFVANQAAGASWIGLEDAAQNNQFVWIDSSVPSFTYWLSTEPSHTAGGVAQNCAAIGTSSSSPHQWADIDCASTTVSSQPIGYVCEDSRTLAELGASVEENAIELALLTQDQSAPDFDPSAAVFTAPLRDAISYDVDRMLHLVPADTAISPATDLGPTVRALGRVLLGQSVLQVDGLGHRPDGTCSNIFVAQRHDSGPSDSPLANYFDAISTLSSVSARQEAVFQLTRLQGAIRCLSSRDLSRLDIAIAEAFISAMERLLDDGKSVAAYALLDRASPIAILIYDAVKSHRLPGVAWLLRFPLDRTQLPQMDIAPFGRTGWARLPAWNDTVTARFYCGAEATNYTLSRLGMWAEDPIHGGSLNRVPMNTWSDESQVTGPCLAVREISEIMSLGAGDCSIMEMAHSDWKCLSERTCVVPPPEELDPNAPPGSASSPLTVLATFRAESEQRNCGAQRLAFRPDRGCLSSLVADTGYLLAGDPGGLQQCTIDAIGDPSPIRFLSNYEGSQTCSDPYGQEGAEDPPAADGDDSTDEDDITNEDDVKKARRIAASEVSHKAEELARSAQQAAGPNGMNTEDVNGFAVYKGAADTISTKLRNGDISIMDTNFTADENGDIDDLGFCPPPCNGGPGSVIQIDQGRIEERSFDLLGAPEGSVANCRADTVCRDILDKKIAEQLAKTIAHEAAHMVDNYAREHMAFTPQGTNRLRMLDMKENVSQCVHKRRNCSSSHTIMYGAGFGQCSPEMPCASGLCMQPDGVTARLLDCSPVDPSEFEDPRCWFEDPCVSYEVVVPECVSGNNPILPDACAVSLCAPDMAVNLLGEAGCCGREALGQLPVPCEALPPSCENSCCWDCAACPADAYLDEQATARECLCEPTEGGVD